MLTVIGCGNTNRADDGVGVHVVRRLQALADREGCSGVCLVDAGTSGIESMLEAAGSKALIYVDANAGGAASGTVAELKGEQIDDAAASGLTLHDFRWDHALRLGRELFKDAFPDDVTVYLIEVSSVEYGTELSAPVAAAADAVVQAVWRRITDAGTDAR